MLGDHLANLHADDVEGSWTITETTRDVLALLKYQLGISILTLDFISLSAKFKLKFIISLEQ